MRHAYTIHNRIRGDRKDGSNMKEMHLIESLEVLREVLQTRAAINQFLQLPTSNLRPGSISRTNYQAPL